MATIPEVRTTLDLNLVEGPVSSQSIVEIIQDGKSVQCTVGEFTKRDTANYNIVADVTIDASVSQTSVIDNSTSSAKTINITGAPAGRAQTFVFVINGAAGVISWANPIVWDKNTQPKPGATRTLVAIFWDGASFTGVQGATA